MAAPTADTGPAAGTDSSTNAAGTNEHRSALIALGTLAIAGVGVVGILLAGGDAALILVWLGACGLGGVNTVHVAQTRELRHTTEQVQQAVGPANGESVTELLAKLTQLEEYQHGRNHDILNALTPLASGMSTVNAQLEQIHQRLAALEQKAA